MANPRIETGLRLERLLALLRHCADNPEGVEIDAVCERFGFDRDQLLKELDVAMMIGSESSKYEDMPFEIYFEDDLVCVHLLNLDKPLRLAPDEALALVISAQALLTNEPADSPLRSGLDKVTAALGLEQNEVIEVEVDFYGGESGKLINQAIEMGRQVRFRYWGYASDQISQRTVEPWHVFASKGAWYLQGFDVDKGEQRKFRIDRITEAVIGQEESRQARGQLDTSLVFDDLTPTVTLEIPGHASWVGEAFPIIKSEALAGGRLRVTLPVAGRSWLERLLLRIGPDATVVAMDDSLGDELVILGAARRILDRYRESDAAGDN